MDRLNDMVDQDPEQDDWKISKIEGHHFKGKEILFKVVWKNQERSLLAMETVRMHDPWIVCRYGFEKKLTHSREWEWVEHYVEADNNLATMVNAYRVSKTDDMAKYKFGVQVPRSPKHALQLDEENGTTGWRDSMMKELK